MKLQLVDLFMLAWATGFILIYVDGRSAQVVGVSIDMLGVGTAFFSNAIKAKMQLKVKNVELKV